MTSSGRRRFLAGAATVSLVVAGVVLLSSLASASAKPQLSEAQILRIALRAAAANGDARPTLIQHSEGTRRAANQIASHDLIRGSAWSYVIAARGKFVAQASSRPAGAPAPRGTVITLVVDAAYGRVTNGGISDRYPALAKLGPVRTDLRSYSACPASDREQLTSTASGSGSALVPAGPRQVLLCRYSGLNFSPATGGRVIAQRLVGYRQAVARLTGEFDALKPFQSGAYACPADFGVKIVAIFRYLPSPRSDDPVTLDPGGCAGVTNGHLTRTAMLAPGPSLIGQLEALTATSR